MRENRALMRPATTIVLAVLLIALFGAALFQFLGGGLDGGGSTKTPPTSPKSSVVRVVETTTAG